MSNANYKLSGTKNIDSIIHVPVEEVIKLCEVYPSMTAQQLSVLLKVSLERLKKEDSTAVPEISTSKKSFFSKLFQ